MLCDLCVLCGFFRPSQQEADHSGFRHRRRHGRLSRAAVERGRRAPRLGVRRPRAVRVAADDVGGAGSRRLVARLSGGDPRGARRERRRRRRDRLCRPVRPDARRGAARRGRARAEAVHHLVRSTHRSRVPLAGRHDRPAAAARVHRESGAHEFHADEAALGARARARRAGAGCVTCCCRRTTSAFG